MDRRRCPECKGYKDGYIFKGEEWCTCPPKYEDPSKVVIMGVPIDLKDSDEKIIKTVKEGLHPVFLNETEPVDLQIARSHGMPRPNLSNVTAEELKVVDNTWHPTDIEGFHDKYIMGVDPASGEDIGMMSEIKDGEIVRSWPVPGKKGHIRPKKTE